jgi:hypothetical protein
MSANSGSSSRATTSLVLGLVGFLCCQLCSPIAWYLGAAERTAIKNGASAPQGEGIATAGMILGIIGTALMALGLIAALLWIVFAGGLAIIGGLASR